MSVAWDIRHYGASLPERFAERAPVIEVSVLCSRCGGDFAAKQFQVWRENTGDAYPPRVLSNCPECVAGRQRALVPLTDALVALREKEHD